MNAFKTGVVLSLAGGAMVAVGRLFGQAGALAGLVLGLVLVILSYRTNERLAIRAAGAVPADPRGQRELYAMVGDLTSSARMPMPRLYLSPKQRPNAFAIGHTPASGSVTVTEGLVAACTWEETRAVLAHELAHLRSHDVLICSVAAALATGLTFLVDLAMWEAVFVERHDDVVGRNDDDEHPLARLAAALSAPMAAALLLMALSRRRELAADRRGAELVGSGEPLARALEKLGAHGAPVPMTVPTAPVPAFLVNPRTGREMSFANLVRTHPSTPERVARLRGQR